MTKKRKGKKYYQTRSLNVRCSSLRSLFTTHPCIFNVNTNKDTDTHIHLNNFIPYGWFENRTPIEWTIARFVFLFFSEKEYVILSFVFKLCYSFPNMTGNCIRKAVTLKINWGKTDTSVYVRWEWWKSEAMINRIYINGKNDKIYSCAAVLWYQSIRPSILSWFFFHLK